MSKVGFGIGEGGRVAHEECEEQPFHGRAGGIWKPDALPPIAVACVPGLAGTRCVFAKKRLAST